MTDNQVKEAISSSYLRAIASRRRHKIVIPEPDHGSDMLLLQVSPYTYNGNTNYADTGRVLSVQLKATTERQIQRRNGVIKYKLRGKTFNDLIVRQQMGRGASPLVLIVFILPEEDQEWVLCDTENLVIKKHAYWYLVPPAAEIMNPESKIIIDIPDTQTLDLDTIENLFMQLIP